MAGRIDLAYATLTAELLERCLDAQFDHDFDEAGAFIKAKAKGRDYWYYKPSLRNGADDKRLYVGPVDDPEISKRVETFKENKSDFQLRRKIVSTLVREARLFSPDFRVGNVLEALWKAGVFRLRACLVGTVAYQSYGTVLGYRFGGASLVTGDIDLAQFHAVSVAVDDSIPPMLDVLRSSDASFRAIPHMADPAAPTRFQNEENLRVDILTPNRGRDELVGRPVRMPSLGGAAAEPLRFLDFLIREPIRSVVLHKGGVPVIVPDPARFAIHKLIVASRRKTGTGKDLKDLAQADQLAIAMTEVARRDDLRAAHGEAMERGASWREAIESSLTRLDVLGMPRMKAALRVP